MAHECPQCHFKANKKQLIYDYNNYDINVRKKFERAEERNPSALAVLEEVKEGVEEIFEFEDEVQEAALQLRKNLEVV
jgi:hypothetical protein